MAGQLVQVATETVTSTTSVVNLLGINDNSVYMLAINNVNNTSQGSVKARVIKASDSSDDSTSNYDSAWKGLRTSTTFSNQSNTNSTEFNALTWSQGSASVDTAQGIFYLYNFFDSSEYSFMTFEGLAFGFSGSELLSAMGGGVHTVAQSNSGIQLRATTPNFESGTFTLYRCV